MLCPAAAPQRWNFNANMTVAAYSNPSLCVAADSCVSAGCLVRLSTCTDSDAQRWLLDAANK